MTVRFSNHGEPLRGMEGDVFFGDIRVGNTGNVEVYFVSNAGEPNRYVARYDEGEARHHYEHPSGQPSGGLLTLERLEEVMAKIDWAAPRAFHLPLGWLKVLGSSRIPKTTIIDEAHEIKELKPRYVQPIIPEAPAERTDGRHERVKGWYRKHDRRDRDPHRNRHSGHHRKAA